MAIAGEYVPSPRKGSRDQVEEIERTGTTDSVDIMGLPVVLLTMVGAKTGRHPQGAAHAGRARRRCMPPWPARAARPSTRSGTGTCAPHPSSTCRTAPSSRGGAPASSRGRSATTWWRACVAAFPPYADYQRKTERLIPVFVLEPVLTPATSASSRCSRDEVVAARVEPATSAARTSMIVTMKRDTIATAAAAGVGDGDGQDDRQQTLAGAEAGGEHDRQHAERDGQRVAGHRRPA